MYITINSPKIFLSFCLLKSDKHGAQTSMFSSSVINSDKRQPLFPPQPNPSVTCQDEQMSHALHSWWNHDMNTGWKRAAAGAAVRNQTSPSGGLTRKLTWRCSSGLSHSSCSSWPSGGSWSNGSGILYNSGMLHAFFHRKVKSVFRCSFYWFLVKKFSLHRVQWSKNSIIDYI